MKNAKRHSSRMYIDIPSCTGNSVSMIYIVIESEYTCTVKKFHALEKRHPTVCQNSMVKVNLHCVHVIQ